jgi:phage anti-repressor protein
MAKNELYESIETTSSKSALDHLVMNLEEPIIIIGGWAVYLLVDERYQKEHNSHYLGSRDVDLGFHIEPNTDKETILKSNFARSLKMIEDLGYFKSGTSRYLRIINKTTKKVLSEKEAASIPQYDLFYMYVDPIVDNTSYVIKNVFKITPIDEPLLGRALKEGKMREMKYLNKKLLLPEVDIIIKMKLTSFPKRTKDDKKIKDACDLYALIWYSDKNYRDLVDNIRSEYNLIEPTIPHFSDDITRKASIHLGIEQETFMDVIQTLWK